MARVGEHLAFWELLHADDFEVAVVDVVNRGGDADTNGAITGALMGARYGALAIRDEWTDTVLTCNPHSPWNGIYHPRVLVGAIDEGSFY